MELARIPELGRVAFEINPAMISAIAGEVAAQALYQGQALTSRNPEIRKTLEESAIEENDHLVWTEHRLQELGEGTSLLKPIWHKEISKLKIK